MALLYKDVTKEDLSNEVFKNSFHAAHVMIYSPLEKDVRPEHKMNFCVLMQFRFDGMIGFPGGEVDPGETPENAVVRETKEEMGIDAKTLQVSKEDLVAIHYNAKKDLLLHFYVKKITIEQLESMEQSTLKSEEYSDEVLGLLRVPLYTLADGFRGFPAFLTQCFVGNAREQLLLGLLRAGIKTQHEIDMALEVSDKHIMLN